MEEIKPYVGTNETSHYIIDNYCYYAYGKKEGEFIKITNDILISATRVRDINKIQDNIIRLEWRNHGIMEGTHNQIRNKLLLEEGIILNKNSGQKFFDYINSQWMEEKYENLSNGYVRRSDIPKFELDISKLKQAIKFFNGFLNNMPFVQQQYVKALICPNFHYILKEECYQKRHLIKIPIINGVTGAGKTGLGMFMYYIFNPNIKYEGLETTPFEFNTQASVRNILSKNSGLVLFDEMDEMIVNVHGNKQLTQFFKDLLKNVYKSNLKGTADLERQGENKSYAFIGSPIVTLNTEVIIETATLERIYYFQCTEQYSLREYQGNITKETIELLRELGKAFWLILKEIDDLTIYTTDEELIKYLVDEINKKCEYTEDDPDRLQDLHIIKQSEPLNKMEDYVYYTLNQCIEESSEPHKLISFIKVNTIDEFLFHPREFCDFVKRVCKDNTISNKTILKAFNLTGMKRESKYWGTKNASVIVFHSDEEILKHIGYTDWKTPNGNVVK